MAKESALLKPTVYESPLIIIYLLDLLPGLACKKINVIKFKLRLTNFNDQYLTVFTK